MDRAEPASGIESKMERFPRDIFFNIFSRLPLKFVIRSSCVSKSWLDIIKDPIFAKLHTSRTKSDPKLLLLKRFTIGEKNIISLNPLKHEGHHLFANESTVVHMVSSLSWDLVGTCEGLLCFTSSTKEDVIICNPITRENFVLPKPGITPPPESCVPMLAFGFNPVENKYKVVRLFYPKFKFGARYGQTQNTVSITAEVYTLGGVNLWREVEGFNYCPHGKPVYACGAIHWLIHPRQYTRDKRIVSFDLGSEKFEQIPHPLFGAEIDIVELGGYLSVVDLSDVRAEILVLKDEQFWNFEYIIPVHKPTLIDWQSPRLLCVHEHNGVLLIWLQDCLMSYERKAIRIREVKIVDFPTWAEWDICCGFKGSLVPLRDSFEGCAEREEDKDVQFVSDVEIHSLLAKAGGFGEKKEGGRCDKIAACFLKNGLLL